MKKSVENLLKRKPTGGKRKAYRGRRKYEIDRYPIETVLGKEERIVKRVRGGNIKVACKSVEYANVVDSKEGKVVKAKILRVVRNIADKDYDRRGVITKGAVIETEAGTARVVSRPGQDGVVNAVKI
ncbi:MULTISPECIES: 30S ribosomal protein S8e [Candidatus Nitrosocaldus]|jgi:small subunit ribosomal protein S8e|uniref:Small ribosomal subunit protein eS8 n=1 Tax=Candidatus Nitrosocaldus cavascurensis TaxID=2058097 RepID=A0A2K5AP37_9ARCH|nr:MULTISPECIES: 30S ribosomal protein S8e [Candidatus Nitrosocaldus]SPC33405.1 30S ribosomal protein S8e [Candidatus Nitrosocaldus cavascurensis]